MSLRRIGVLLQKELVHGSRSFIFIFALVVPIVLTLLLTLVFGTIFSGTPKLGLVDEGQSEFVTLAQDLAAVTVRIYDTPAEMRDAAARGAIDLGMVLPANFDEQVTSGTEFEVTAYAWGESKMQHRAILGTAVATLIRDMTGAEPPFEVVTTTLGDGANVPWETRLLPFVVLMTVLLGGIMMPATSLVEEKQKRTLTGITITPLSYGETYVAKGLVGVVLTIVMTVIVLVMNQALGERPLLLIGALALGGIMAATFGVLLGSLVSDINTLFATIKGLGILLYAPAIIDMFPSLPAWVDTTKLFFPTYYIINPVIQISQNNASFADVGLELGILAVLILALMGVIVGLSQRTELQLA